jgi:hypothetical protein
VQKPTEALDLSEPGGFIRLFVDLGPQMAELLRRLVKENVALGYIGGSWLLSETMNAAHRLLNRFIRALICHLPSANLRLNL